MNDMGKPRHRLNPARLIIAATKLSWLGYFWTPFISGTLLKGKIPKVEIMQMIRQKANAKIYLLFIILLNLGYKRKNTALKAEAIK